MADEILMEVQRTLGRLEAKLEDALDLRDRVEKLERWRAYLAGSTGLLALLWAVGTAILGFVLK